MKQSLKRIYALTRKETTQILRDWRTLALILIVPIIEMLLFAYAVTLKVDHIPTVVADMSMSARSQAFTAALANSGYFDIEMHAASEAEVIQIIDKGDALAGVVIPPNFESGVERGGAQALLLLDGSDAFTMLSGYLASASIAQTQMMDLTIEKLGQMGVTTISSLPITTLTRILYNPNIDDMIFIVPATAAMLLQIMTVAMTGESVVREHQLGTMEGLLITPARPWEIIIGKLIPNILVAAVDLLSVTLVGIVWFGVPFQGSPLLFTLLSLLFIFAGLGLGLLVSTIARTEEQVLAVTALLIVFSVMLTGFIYPRSAMPRGVQLIGNFLPLTYFTRITRGIFTKGIGMRFIWTDAVALAIYSTVIMLAASKMFNKRLD